MQVTRSSRILLFLLVCLSVRLSFVWLAKHATHPYLQIMGVVAFGISFAFMYQFIANKNVGAFGGAAWWNLLRPFHALTYFIFGILALKGMHQYAWMVLLLDVLVGLIAFLQHYFI